jgi:hypothetical protein
MRHYPDPIIELQRPSFSLTRAHRPGYAIPGEYISITEHDRVMRTLSIIWVRDI